jgi:ribosome-associated protein
MNTFPDFSKDDDLTEPLPPSKTQRKKAMHEAQDLGAALVDVSTDKLRMLGLPERLFDAIVEAKGIKKHEARRRQLQFIGKLMRDVDVTPIREFLDSLERQPAAEKAKMAMLENWRVRLLEDPAALMTLKTQFPEINLAAWNTRIAAAKQGMESQVGKNAYRNLFRDLKKLFD